MKRIIILFCIVAFAQRVQAQTTQGSVVATGSFNYFTSLGEGEEGSSQKTNRFNISPQIGYMVSDNLEIGLFANLDKYNYHSETLTTADEWNFSKHQTTSKAIGSYLRKYVFLTDKLAFTGKGEINYSTYTSTYNSFKNTNGRDYDFYSTAIEDSQFEAAVRPGLSFFLSDKISLNTTYGALSYTIHSSDYESLQENYQNEMESNGYHNKKNKLSLDLSTSSFMLGLSYFF